PHLPEPAAAAVGGEPAPVGAEQDGRSRAEVPFLHRAAVPSVPDLDADVGPAVPAGGHPPPVRTDVDEANVRVRSKRKGGRRPVGVPDDCPAPYRETATTRPSRLRANPS